MLNGAVANGLSQSTEPTGIEKRYEHAGSDRSYRIHVPEPVKKAGVKVPVVFCLHGGGTDAALMSKAGWTARADLESFIVVYPEGLNGRWNDGRKVRKFAAQDAVTDDVEFVIHLLDYLIKTQPIDPARVYLTGLSNGGFMTQRLAIEHTGRFAAIAVQIASLSSTYVDGRSKFTPRAPLSVLFLNGTEDPFMPYTGGKLTPNMAPKLIDRKTFDFGQDSAIAVVDAVNLWVKHNQIDPSAPKVSKLPDKDPTDGCEVIHHRWQNEGGTVSVELYQIKGGGHTIPGGAQYLPERIIGAVCHDIDGIETIWKFFKSRSRTP